METFSALLALCEGIQRSPVDFPHNGQWRGALMLSLICTWTNGWANTWDAADLRRSSWRQCNGFVNFYNFGSFLPRSSSCPPLCHLLPDHSHSIILVPVFSHFVYSKRHPLLRHCLISQKAPQWTRFRTCATQIAHICLLSYKVRNVVNLINTLWPEEMASYGIFPFAFSL